MAVRIQLASNFQVIELTYDSWREVDHIELEAATAMVNSLGQEVVNDIKTPANKKDDKKEEMATPGQVKYLVGLGIDESVAKKMTKKGAWNYLKEHNK